MSDTCSTTFESYDEDGAWENYGESAIPSDGTVTCGECNQIIPAGMRVIHCTGDNGQDDNDADFEAYSEDVCAACHILLAEFFDGGWTFTTLWDRMFEEWDDGAPLQPCLNRVHSVAAKAKLRLMWLKHKGLVK